MIDVPDLCGALPAAIVPRRIRMPGGIYDNEIIPFTIEMAFDSDLSVKL